MCQTIHYRHKERTKTFRLPSASEEVIPGIMWGCAEQPFTPAFWATQVRFLTSDSNLGKPNFRLGRSFREEAVACLLGGHGIPAEVGLAAFSRLRDLGILNEKPPTEAEVLHALQQPLNICGRSVRYRFARQKSSYVTRLLQLTDEMPPNLSDRQLRHWLLQCPGIGFKTASWITRNWRASDDVAIIDIHIHRAGLFAGFFLQTDNLPRDYLAMEDRYLTFASAIGVRASLLDAVIWQQMRRCGTLIRNLLQEMSVSWGTHIAA